LQKNIRNLLPLFGIVGAFIVIGAVVIGSGLLPEEGAKRFNPLSTVSINSEMKIVQEPSLGNNVFIYAINEVAQRGIDIAVGDARVNQILKEASGRKAAVTIAAVEPTVITDRQSGKLLFSPAGQIIITSNWQSVDGILYSKPKSFAQIVGKTIESHQQIWHVFVNLDKYQVTQITQQADRATSDVVRPNRVDLDVNMFAPNAILVDAGSTIRWSNLSNLPHNVVGVFNQTSTIPSNRTAANQSAGLAIGNSTSTDNSYNNKNKNSSDTSDINNNIGRLSSSSGPALDSGFIQPGNSWQHRFDREGVFSYQCTIHSEEGMRGIVVVVHHP
jgi:plastocyanin